MPGNSLHVSVLPHGILLLRIRDLRSILSCLVYQLACCGTLLCNRHVLVCRALLELSLHCDSRPLYIRVCGSILKLVIERRKLGGGTQSRYKYLSLGQHIRSDTRGGRGD
jgi:hypothetical protein